IPFTGTELAEMANDSLKNNQITLDPLKMNYQNTSLNISAMSNQELKKLSMLAYRHFYMNPMRILKLIKLAMQHPEFFSVKRLAGMFIFTFIPRNKRSR
ncbi:MAG: hypothetical protein QMD11_12270, partial [Smithella sp.]|nr:hypothetical protein [Smithella sp.]